MAFSPHFQPRWFQNQQANDAMRALRVRQGASPTVFSAGVGSGPVRSAGPQANPNAVPWMNDGQGSGAGAPQGGIMMPQFTNPSGAQQPQQNQSGGFPMFSQPQQPAPFMLPWQYGQAVNTSLNYGQLLQNAMGQMGAQLNANADRISAARPIQAAYDIDRRGQDYQHEAMMAQIANQGRFMDMMGQGFGGMGQGPMGSVNVTGGPAMADQTAASGARDNLYGGLMGDLSGAAFTGSGIPGFQTPGGEVSAQVPTPPWAGGQPGSVQAGIDTTPGTVWNQDFQDQARTRLGNFAQRTLPFLNAAPGSGREGLAQNFQDLVGGLGSRSLSDLSRAGTRAEGGHQLASQTASSQAQNALLRLMADIYGSDRFGDVQGMNRTLKMIQALSGPLGFA